jgi:hypothetical protein
MTWTFNSALTTPRDRVRLHIGDTNTADQQLPDETLDALLVRYPNEFRCAEMACQELSGRYAREIDRDVRDTTVHEGDRAKHYRSLAWLFRWRR